MSLRDDANFIINHAITEVLPDSAVRHALQDFTAEHVFVVAIGKAAWQMAKVAGEVLGESIADGVVITKYDHVLHDIPNMRCYEAGHPVSDENTFAATQAAVDMVKNLTETDTVLFLVSGGGSALFELSPVLEEVPGINKQLLASGADIVEMNTIRKRLSLVKGGRFAKICEPAKVFSVVLSDIIGNPLSMIASGPAYPDSSTCEDALRIVRKYGIRLSDKAMELLKQETPKDITNVETVITGSVEELCRAAADGARQLGYEPEILTGTLDTVARDAGTWLGKLAAEKCAHNDGMADNAPAASGMVYNGTGNNGSGNIKYALIAGGETVVRITGKGKGGRNQELALSAAREIDGLDNVAVFSVGSDGTDGPTDAAGGYVDGATKAGLEALGMDIDEYLNDNDSYNALKAVDGLIITGPTGTNVNDVAVALIT